jgi:hypothetical protein
MIKVSEKPAYKINMSNILGETLKIEYSAKETDVIFVVKLAILAGEFEKREKNLSDIDDPLKREGFKAGGTMLSN